jgi:hypothetical protein
MLPNLVATTALAFTEREIIQEYLFILIALRKKLHWIHFSWHGIACDRNVKVLRDLVAAYCFHGIFFRHW